MISVEDKEILERRNNAIFHKLYRWSNLCDLKIINTDKFHRENKFRLKRFILLRCIAAFTLIKKKLVFCPLQIIWLIGMKMTKLNTFFDYLTKHIFIYFYVIMNKKNPLFILPILSQNIFDSNTYTCYTVFLYFVRMFMFFKIISVP